MLKISVDTRGNQAAFEGLSARVLDLKDPLQAVGDYGALQAQQRLSDRPAEWHPHTGELGRSITATVTLRAGSQEVEVGSDLVYARIQQEGGTVRPVRGKYLALPIPDFLAKQGTLARNFPGKLKFKRAVQIKIGTRAWRGPALVAPGATPEGGRPMYALIKKAVIPARPYLIWDDDWANFAEKTLLDHMVGSL